MPRIKNFHEFALNEADELPADPALTPTDPAAAAPAPADPNKPPKHAADTVVVGKKFFRELKTHVEYWFAHGRIAKKMTLDSVEDTDTGLCIWAKLEHGESEEPYSVRVEMKTPNPGELVEKIESVVVATYVFNADQDILKQSEVVVKVAELGERRLRNEVTKVTDAIIKKPETSTDVKKFTRTEPKALGDAIY